MAEPYFAISVKQPWAALIVAGIKTIEVRSWPTRRRGRILIHSGKLPDRRAEGWDRLTTPELREAAKQVGGIIGVARILACKSYPSERSFAADRNSHLNEPSWFKPPRLYGFVLGEPRALEFHSCNGQTSFFRINDYKLG